MSKLIKRLSSPRLAWWLLLVLLGCLIVSFLVPQRALVGEQIYSAWRADAGFIAVVAEALGFAAVFSSPIFLIAMVLLFVNLSFCTARRVSARARRRIGVPPAPAGAATIVLAEGVEPAAARSLAAPAWALATTDDGGYVWERGLWGWRGSILMHLGLLLLLVAGLVSALTRFSGEIVLAEGQTLTDTPEAYVAIQQSPYLGAAFSGAPITLRDLEVTYDGSTIVDVAAQMSQGPNGPVHVARVNEPFRVGGKAFLLSKSGHAVAVRITEKDEPLLEAVVNLGGVSGLGNTDHVTVRPGLDVTMTVIPDASAKARRPLLLVDPVVEIEATGGTAPVRLKPGQSAKIGPVTIEVLGVSYWTQFLARSDKGLPIAYLAFAMVLVGLIARWLDPDVRVMLVREEPGDDDTAPERAAEFEHHAQGTRVRVWYRARFSEAAARRATAALVAELTDTVAPADEPADTVATADELTDTEGREAD